MEAGEGDIPQQKREEPVSQRRSWDRDSSFDLSSKVNELYAKGFSDPIIAIELRVTPKTVMTERKKLGLPALTLAQIQQGRIEYNANRKKTSDITFPDRPFEIEEE